MIALSKVQIAAYRAEAMAIKRSVDFVEGSSIDKDLYSKQKRDVLKTLSESKLTNEALLSEMNERLAVEADNKVVQIIVERNVVAKHEEAVTGDLTAASKYKARQSAKAELELSTPRSIAGRSIDARAFKLKVQAEIANIKATNVVAWLELIALYGECVEGQASGMTELNWMRAIQQFDRVAPSKKYSQDTDIYRVVNVDDKLAFDNNKTMKSINDYTAANPLN